MLQRNFSIQLIEKGRMRERKMINHNASEDRSNDPGGKYVFVVKYSINSRTRLNFLQFSEP